jgi:hypothetical protein
MRPTQLLLMSPGPNVVTNGGFDEGATGWTDRKTGGGTLSFAGGVATIVGTDGSNRGWFTQTLALIPQRWYWFSFTAVVTSGTLFPIFGATNGTGAATVTASGQYRIRLQASAATIYVGAQTGSGGGNATFDNFTVRRC